MTDKKVKRSRFIPWLRKREELTDKKVMVPWYVDEFICNGWPREYVSDDDKSIIIRQHEELIDGHGNDELKEWVKDDANFLLFVEALVNGYDVEKRKLYHVVLPTNQGENTKISLVRKRDMVRFEFATEEMIKTRFEHRLSEREIRSFDERLMRFAIEVEDVRNDR